jgi:DNA repair protein RecO (recombination protein O)
MSESNVISDNYVDLLSKGREVSVSAIVLRARPYRDSDLMAQLLTPNLGKISVIGRHARGSKKRFPSSLDIFDRGVARIAKERGGHLSVKEFTPSHSLKKVRADLDKLALCSLLCESFDLIIQEDRELHGQAELFEVLDLALNAIDEATDTKQSLRATTLALTSLTKHEGIIDLSAHQPGSRLLNAALDSIERFTERKLMARDTLKGIYARFGSS